MRDYRSARVYKAGGRPLITGSACRLRGAATTRLKAAPLTVAMKVRRTTMTQRAAASLALASLVWLVDSVPRFFETEQLLPDVQTNNISIEESEPTFESNYDSDFPNDWLEPESFCSPIHLMEDLFNHYASFPLSLLRFNSVHSCEELDKDRRIVELESYNDLQPEWLAEGRVLGECPWELVRRVFTSDTVPPSIVEVSCLCDGHICSSLGDFKCVPVTSFVKVWTMEHHSFGRYRAQMVMVTAACVCAQRLGLEGGNAQSGLNY
ncbi:uncharacterized protein [Panulirus ornatus]|uniref:uncharacterized protein n=1 Tax=Panulirus ornatus TaxID=150431 RepID=UPI003A8BD3F0